MPGKEKNQAIWKTWAQVVLLKFLCWSP
jgi:hypothetical protein